MHVAGACWCVVLLCSVPLSAQDAPQGSAAEQREQMQSMAEAMKNMAQTCQMMMEREMAARPLMLAAGWTIAALAFVALLLFVVLEVQWIRFFRLRIRQEQTRLGAVS